MAKKATEIVVAPTQALTDWDAEMAKYAQEVSDTEKAGGKFISVKGGVLTVDGVQMEDNKMTVVILDQRHENVFYKGAYDPNNLSSPHCFAFGVTEDGMAPHADAAEPQSETCEACPNNVFGSADVGKGKACKNSRRLALISANGLTAENVKDAEVRYLKIPVTSVKAWSGFVKKVAAELRRPPFGVVTEVELIPGTPYMLHFKPASALETDFMPPIMTLRERVASEIEFPYEKPAVEEATKPGAKVAKRKF